MNLLDEGRLVVAQGAVATRCSRQCADTAVLPPVRGMACG